MVELELTLVSSLIIRISTMPATGVRELTTLKGNAEGEGKVKKAVTAATRSGRYSICIRLAVPVVVPVSYAKFK